MCLRVALIKFWFQTDLGRENSAIFYRKGRHESIKILTHHGHARSRSKSNFYALIGQNLTGEFMRKTYAVSRNVFTDTWNWQSFVSSCDVLTAAFKILLLFMAGLFIGFLVEKCAVCQSHRKSDFTWRRFRFSTCFMRKRVEKSQAISALLDGFQELHLYWCLELILKNSKLWKAGL